MRQRAETREVKALMHLLGMATGLATGLRETLGENDEWYMANVIYRTLLDRVKELRGG